jgi:cell division protein FtsB
LVLGKVANEQENRTKKPKSYIIPYLLLWAVIGCMVGMILSHYHLRNYNELAVTESELKRAITSQERMLEELDRQRRYIHSDEFIERFARENLGYIRDDEIVFRNRRD